MKRSFYSDSITGFLHSSKEQILGGLSISNEFSLEITQKESWIQQIKILKEALKNFEAKFSLNIRSQEWEEGLTSYLLLRM